MAEHFSFFDPVIQIDGTYDREYNAQQFTNYFKTLVTTGVLRGEKNELKLIATGSTMQTKIDTGVAFILGRYYENDSLKELTHDTESLGVSRIDRVVIRMDLSTEARYVKSFIKKGAPSPNPVPPTLTQTQNVYEISLAQVRVVGGQTFIAANAITDERGTSIICPWAGSNILPNFDDSELEGLIQKVDNSWQKNIYNNVEVMNLGSNSAEKVFNIKVEDWKSSVNVEVAYVCIPISAYSGTIRVTLASDYVNSDAGGGAIIEFSLITYGATVHKHTKTVNSITDTLARQYYIDDIAVDTGYVYIPVKKAPSARNPVSIKLELVCSSPIFDAVNSSFISIIDSGSPTGMGYPWALQKGLDQRITENFTLVSNGKAQVANAITDMGVPTSTTAEFATMATNIRNLSNIISGTGTITNNGTQTFFNVTGLSFKPRAYMFRTKGGNIPGSWGVHNSIFSTSEFVVVINHSSYGNVSSVFDGGFTVAAAYPNGTGQFDWWAIK